MGAVEKSILVVCIVFFYLWFANRQRQHRQEGLLNYPVVYSQAPLNTPPQTPYMDSWNWDIKGPTRPRTPLQTSGMDVLFPVYDYVYAWPSSWPQFEPVSSWYHDSVTYGPISKPWGPSSYDLPIRF
jgi:hypothetical protein